MENIYRSVVERCRRKEAIAAYDWRAGCQQTNSCRVLHGGGAESRRKHLESTLLHPAPRASCHPQIVPAMLHVSLRVPMDVQQGSDAAQFLLRKGASVASPTAKARFVLLSHALAGED